MMSLRPTLVNGILCGLLITGLYTLSMDWCEWIADQRSLSIQSKILFCTGGLFSVLGGISMVGYILTPIGDYTRGQATYVVVSPIEALFMPTGFVSSVPYGDHVSMYFTISLLCGIFLANELEAYWVPKHRAWLRSGEIQSKVRKPW